MSNRAIKTHSRRASARAKARAAREAAEPNKYVTPKEAAERLGCSVDSVYHVARAGGFPNAKHDGSLLLVPTDDIRALRAKDDRSAR